VLFLDWLDAFYDADGDRIVMVEGGPSGLADSGTLAVGDASKETLKFTPAFGSGSAEFSVKARDSNGAESSVTRMTLTFGELSVAQGEEARRRA
jgi:hypothetical protein